MILDQFRRKTRRPTGGGNSSLETTDITDQVPQIEDVLAEVDKAIDKANRIEDQIQPQSHGFCGC